MEPKLKKNSLPFGGAQMTHAQPDATFIDRHSLQVFGNIRISSSRPILTCASVNLNFIYCKMALRDNLRPSLEKKRSDILNKCVFSLQQHLYAYTLGITLSDRTLRFQSKTNHSCPLFSVASDLLLHR